MHVLILGGTTEGRRLAELLDGATGVRVTSSLAGRVASPRMPVGDVRIGGFGGVQGLTEWLRTHLVDVLIDATHPFAETISFHAAEAAAAAHVPLLALRRPGWVPSEGDNWHMADSLGEAALLLPRLGRRIFLTTGRLGLSAFAGPGTEELWFLVRTVDPPEDGQPTPARMELLLDRGPFCLEGEREVLHRHRIDVVVTKDSGGTATAPKLTAAREAGLPVVVVRRPPVPDGVRVCASPEAAAEAVRAL
ncbi:cobalt-precorrin-6A reductase [Streptomyces sp. 8N114]|uniref:cobalt-precorrin-6A reductase n=1 Tax=Streptomyces sp. 8N114 TaxID=3457419 RepID=UPI003FD3F506